MSFYKPIGELNLHPGYANITDGDEHLGDLVAKLQASPQYADMLIIIAYDEHGGFWDHVAPPVRDRWGPGIRVPLIAVGPTVRCGAAWWTIRSVTSARSCEPSRTAGASIPRGCWTGRGERP